MNNNNHLKTNQVIIFCVVLSAIIAIISTFFGRNHKQIEPEKKPVSIISSDPVPSTSDIDSNLSSSPETKQDDEETEHVFPNQVHYIAGWDKTLDQLNIDCDVVFMGDSITYKSSFEVEFPELDICNLSVSSDTIKGVNYRVGTLETVKPEKVFLMIGINSLKNNNLDKCISDYTTLVDDILTRGSFDLYLMSILPMAKNDSGIDNPSPEIIVSLNKAISEIADQRNAVYVDLYSLLEDSGYIKPEYTTDGLHLSDAAYEVWTDCIRPYLD